MQRIISFFKAVFFTFSVISLTFFSFQLLYVVVALSNRSDFGRIRTDDLVLWFIISVIFFAMFLLLKRVENAKHKTTTLAHRSNGRSWRYYLI